MPVHFFSLAPGPHRWRVLTMMPRLAYKPVPPLSIAAGARVTVLVITAVMLAMPSLVGQTEPVDLQAVYKIKDEGLQRSKVMEIASYLTDVYGPRLTGSPEIRRAGEWAVKELQSWGLANVTARAVDGFGRGWTNERFSAHMTAPATATLIGYPKAWTPGHERRRQG